MEAGSHHEYVADVSRICNWLDPERESQDWVNSFAGQVSTPWLLVLPPNRRNFVTLRPARVASNLVLAVKRLRESTAVRLLAPFAMSSSQIMYAYVMRPESLYRAIGVLLRSGPQALKPCR